MPINLPALASKFLGREAAPNDGKDINSLIAHFAKFGDVNKTDKFDVTIPLPNKLAVGDFKSRELSFQCENAEIPSVDVVPIEYRHYGFQQKIPHHLVYPPLSLTFYCNSELMEKKLFDNWANLCIPNATGLVEYSEDNTGFKNYETNIKVNLYNSQGQLRYYAEMVDAFPISVSQLSTNWADDSVQRLTVTFAYKKWITDADKAEQALDPLDAKKVTNYTNLEAILGNARVLAPTIIKKIIRNNI